VFPVVFSVFKNIALSAIIRPQKLKLAYIRATVYITTRSMHTYIKHIHTGNITKYRITPVVGV
jgi:hypothetical protein